VLHLERLRQQLLLAVEPPGLGEEVGPLLALWCVGVV
jgi:hypothetical protein